MILRVMGRNKHRQTLWQCACDCGNVITIPSCRFVTGNTRSCGCLNRERLSERFGRKFTHGHATGGTVSPTYRSWQSMRNRCLYTGDRCYSTYGGAGITVCPRWRESFEAFFADVGERPSGKTIDRIDGSKGYLCGRFECCGQDETNCRWATPTEQTRNRKATKLSSAKVIDIRTRRAAGRDRRSIARSHEIKPRNCE